MITTESKILNLKKQLFPTGRAFKVSKGTDLYKLQEARSQVEAGIFDDALLVLDATIPDNDNFTEEDATRWEERLGMIINEGVDLEDRKAAIRQKLNHPGDILARQSSDYLQQQLRAAGFDVYVHENTTPVYPDFYDLNGMVSWQHGQFQHGQLQHGRVWGDVIANSLDFEKDLPFGFRDNYRGTFFVGGETIGSFANVNEDRRTELRRLILQLKPCESIGFLFITYTY